MKAQFYYNDQPPDLRIFDIQEGAWRQMIMDCYIPESEPGLYEADSALKRCNIKRTSKWRLYPSGGFYEAQVSFNNKPIKNRRLCRASRKKAS